MTVDGHWASWDSWAACTATCGGGKELRGRICTYQAGVPRGNNCSGDVSEARDCNPDTCPGEKVSNHLLTLKFILLSIIN